MQCTLLEGTPFEFTLDIALTGQSEIYFNFNVGKENISIEYVQSLREYRFDYNGIATVINDTLTESIDHQMRKLSKRLSTHFDKSLPPKTIVANVFELLDAAREVANPKFHDAKNLITYIRRFELSIEDCHIIYNSRYNDINYQSPLFKQVFERIPLEFTLTKTDSDAMETSLIDLASIIHLTQKDSLPIDISPLSYDQPTTTLAYQELVYNLFALDPSCLRLTGNQNENYRLLNPRLKNRFRSFYLEPPEWLQFYGEDL